MTGREGSVVVRIYGEIRDLVAKLRTGGDEVGRFATSSRNVITKSFSDISSIITSRMGRVGGEVQKSLDRVGASAASSGSGIALGVGAGAAVAAAGIADLAAKGVRSFVNLGESVRQFQEVSGATAEDASRMVAVLKLFNIDAETGARGLFMLAKNVENHADKLGKDNIAIARNRSGHVDLLQTLLNVGDAYKKAGGGAEGAKVASDAFGKSGLALLPILSQSRDQIEAFWKAAQQHGEVLNQGDVDKAHQFHLALKELEASVGGLERALGEGLVPALTDVARTATSVIDKLDGLAKHVGGVKNIVGAFIDVINPAVGFLGLFGKKHKDVADSADQAASALGDATSAIEGQASAADAATTALSAYDKVMHGVTDSVLGIPSAVDDVNKAFLDLETTSTTATTKAADAQTRLAEAIESANRRIRDAQQAVSDSTEDLNKQSHGDRTDARRRVRDAEQRLADARAESAESIARAKKNVDDLNPTLDDANKKTLDIKKNMEGVVTAVEKTVDEMIKNHRPASEILDYITKQRDRLGEVGTKIGLDRIALQLYLDVLQQVYQTTKDLAALVTVNGFATGPVTPAQQGAATLGRASHIADLITSGLVINQNFYGPTDPAEQQRQANKQFNGALRRRG